ncbi:MAG: lysophospholipid acyltransferase family protein [Bacilli bacterium]
MKENHKIGYTINKYLLGGIFLLYYRPKIINKDYIPKDGPIILCGNHNHLLDQCLPILSTKRMLHYLAKKEYFDGPFAFFFKICGCIPVNREIHDSNAKNEAIEFLRDGYAIGIYPEGTRNSIFSKKDKLDEIYVFVKDTISYKKFKKIMKKNMTRVSQTDLLLTLLSNNKITKDEFIANIYNVDNYLKTLVTKNIITEKEYDNSLLLPFKYGTVSMAQKTGATIVPYAITGHYRFSKNNLKITFLKPVNVGLTDDLIEKNNIIYEEINSFIKNANK